MRTFSPKADDIQRQWHIIDASDVVLGRLATQAAIWRASAAGIPGVQPRLF